MAPISLPRSSKARWFAGVLVTTAVLGGSIAGINAAATNKSDDKKPTEVALSKVTIPATTAVNSVTTLPATDFAQSTKSFYDAYISTNANITTLINTNLEPTLADLVLNSNAGYDQVLCAQNDPQSVTVSDLTTSGATSTVKVREIFGSDENIVTVTGNTTTKKISAIECTTMNAGTESKGFLNAKKVVESKGYKPYTSGNVWTLDENLNAIVATPTAANAGSNMRVFFFKNGAFVGTDTVEGSGGLFVKTVSSDTQAVVTDTLAVTYNVYKADDPHCCPTGGTRTVEFKVTGTTVKPLSTVPAFSER